VRFAFRNPPQAATVGALIGVTSALIAVGCVALLTRTRSLQPTGLRATGAAGLVHQDPGAFDRTVLYTNHANSAKSIDEPPPPPRRRRRRRPSVVTRIGVVACASPRVMSIESATRAGGRSGRRALPLIVREVDSPRVLCFIAPKLSEQGGVV
jgi:hypothetical protein